MLQRFSDPKTVLVMSFELNVHSIGFNYLGRKSQMRAVHLMFWQPNNYSKVFWNIRKNGIRTYREYETWNLECDHDSA
ncbi:hypothetical protein KGQ34_02570 [Patescibacteria group bacterium]|nr:hypothetical protein [Patescibacteria group bacterium]